MTVTTPSHGSPRPRLAAGYRGPILLENSLAFSYQVKHTLTMKNQEFHIPRCGPERNGNKEQLSL